MSPAPGCEDLGRSYTSHCLHGDTRPVLQFSPCFQRLLYDVEICRSVCRSVGLSVSLPLVLSPPTPACPHRHTHTPHYGCIFVSLGTHGQISQGRSEGILTDSPDGPEASGALCSGHPDCRFLPAVSKGHSALEAARIPWTACLPPSAEPAAVS